ncbi:MAG: iron-sulfur cluster-binding protein [Chloroflexi bacterium]|nr:iron-sulfur cluster-binding protein [Chloroflexota bacterium]
MAHLPKLSFDRRVDKALHDPNLQLALGKSSDRFLSAREQALAEFGREFYSSEALRDRGRQIRQDVLDHLDAYLPKLSDAAQRNGTQVHWAITAADATRIVIDIAQSHGVTMVAKSKSMVTEEMDLNHALEAAGIEPVETDLGEWIVQLAGETPSHIIAPAVHKTKAQIVELFEHTLQRKIPDDIPAMTALAREALRPKFLQAGMGLSGVNFAIAETGTLVTVSNEGNARLVTTVPKIHVAVMGIEKVCPTWDDFAVLIQLLPRSATGQKLSTYTHFISGPRRPGEPDGPDEVHLIIVDNGRSALLGTAFEESLMCIRCGACLNACPVYRQIGGHAYGGVYSGPIGAVQTPLLQGFEHFRELPHASTLCGACLDACPVKIDIPRMLLDLRTEEAEKGEGFAGKARAPWLERLVFFLFGYFLRFAWLYRVGSRLGYWLMRPFARNGRARWLPFPVSRWTKNRDFPAMAARPFHARWQDIG